MKLTKLKALEICMKLWKWLERNNAKHKEWTPDKRKKSWPGWNKYGYMDNGCPCCEYSHQATRSYCGRRCLLKSAWPNGCCSNNSPYWEWSNGNYRPKYARQIWKACEAEIAKIKKKKGKKK